MNFEDRFKELTGNVPYDWQTQLFGTLVSGHIPLTLSLPTGTGKTSAIVCWLLALCKNFSLPRRLVYVVDRRSVVDQSTKVVEDIAARLFDSPALTDVRNALAQMAGEFADEGLLGTSTLRGEFQDNQEWSKLPFRAAVVCGTVDMVGSRLLFSGYGDGAYSRSLHSGLLGNDTLVVFDECHLVPEFANILQLVKQAGGKLKPFHYMLMSATGDGQGTTIELSDADKKSPVLGKRLKAPKTLHLVNTDKPVIQQITILAQKDPPLRTIVFVQSPQDVSRIASSLKKNHKHVITLTGTMRGKERDELVSNPVFNAFTVVQEPAEPHFLIATSAGEVGIDLTCSLMVTDIASIASLVQRFGRCNRFAEAEGHIYLVYNEKRLWQQSKEAIAYFEKLGLDVSCLNLWNHREGLAAVMPQTIAVHSLPSHVLDVLSMTSVHHDIDVSLYLRGQDEQDRYVEIAWRKEVPLLVEMNDTDFDAYMKHMRVLSFEKLNESVHRAKEVIAEIVKKQGDSEVAVITQGGTRLIAKLAELQRVNLVNCLLILPEGVGGLSGSMFSVTNADGFVLDVAELEHKQHKARVRIIQPADQTLEIKAGWRVVFETEVSDLHVVIMKEKEGKKFSKQFLDEHSKEVALAARRFAELSGLDADTFEKAGLYHDAGKASPLWQFAAKGGSVENPLAKATHVDAKKLNGFRHEFASLNSVNAESDEVRHIVAAHHAGARPTWTGDRSLSPANQNPDRVLEGAKRFSSLLRKHGWWGLAYLEAVLRTADAYMSADEL